MYKGMGNMKDLIKKQKGFTIIEVLIVLAIAGLIILIVFLAVPALQRNSRNTQRSNDASQVGGALNECFANRNGQIASCDSTAELQALGLDTAKLGQLTVVNVAPGAPTDPGATVTNTINVGFGSRCNADGAGIGGGSPRQAAGLYRVEIQGSNNGAVRCIEF